MANIIRPPKWAKYWGKDEYGYWVSLEIKEVEQRFRWIEPGEFMMGSPEDEVDRKSDEVLHKVRLTEGYWLADTTCTQELWQLIMDNNPSRFKGKDLPVESISWNMIEVFINKLNDLVGDNVYKLPTEAQWEYACRAGTNTPFSFGATINSEQVNFDGYYPYGNDQKSKNRERTIAVKALDCNKWGLYQMHGNVWEWCNDWYGEYDTGKEITINPRGLNLGEYRVLRGGSWFDLAGSCRSAYRINGHPGTRVNDVGFRLSSGHPAQAK